MCVKFVTRRLFSDCCDEVGKFLCAIIKLQMNIYAHEENISVLCIQ